MSVIARCAALALLVACGDHSHVTPDAQHGPIAYALSVDPRGDRPDPPQVFIDGVETQVIHAVYPDLTSADGFQHTVELRYADHVVASYETSTDTTDCTRNLGGTVVSVTVDLFALDSGDIRYFGDTIQTSRGGCTGDGSGAAACYCEPAERCAPRITLADPLFTKMACTPIGPKAAGDPCTLTDDPDGAYDDCGENLVCLAGTCTPFCSPDVPEGYPPEVRCP